MRSRHLRETAGGSEFCVPVAGILDGALLSAEIHVGEAESLGIAFGPFEIVEQAPVMIGANVDAVEHGAAEGMEVTAQELDAPVVSDAAVLVRAVEIGAAVLGDFERRGFVFA